MSKERLDKLLAAAGLGTRKGVAILLRAGRVTGDGQICKDGACKIDLMQQCVIADGLLVEEKKSRYYMLHKPAGYVSATTDNFQQTVLQLFPENLRKDLFPVGRLDKDTE